MIRRVVPGAEVTVSVVMPYFNHGMFVGQAIASVRSQSRPVDEIVIVDDGSTEPQSLDVLKDLETEGVTVVRQANQGPSAARNAGVARSRGDAVLFLDSDDLLSAGQVEAALRTLSAAGPDVGFAYPDMQFFGNEHDLVVMPPYNLYLLLHRNFCGMGSLIDRSVFEAGARFRTELVRGHEDWDFFVNLGKVGIYGAIFHGEPLMWRRWGYSRSDSVQEERGSFLGEMRELHPDLFDSARLIGVKQAWSPALSVVAPLGVDPGTPGQTCDDYEVVMTGARAEVPDVRGRWVAVLGPQGHAPLGDPTFVERLLRIVNDRPVPVALGLAPGPSGSWVRAAQSQGPEAGVVVDADTYEQWRQDASPGDGARALLSHLDPLGEPREWWTTGGPAGGGGAPGATEMSEPRVALRPPARPQGGAGAGPGEHDDLTERGVRTEIGFRRFEATPLFIPAGGFERLPDPPKGYRDGLEALTRRAWSGWVPSRTRRLELVVDPNGRAFLETSDDDAHAAGVGTRFTLGRIWVRPFPGTACLYSSVDIKTHYYSYRVTNDPPRDRFELPVGYVAVEQLDGMVDLAGAIEALGRSDAAGLGIVMVPPIDAGATGAFIEDTGGPDPGPAVITTTGAGRRWPLYELLTQAGAYRYTRSPDACVGRTDLQRPSVNAIADLAEPRNGGGLSNLYEVRFKETGGMGYTGGAELASGLGHLEAVQVLGDITERAGVNTPMVRLHPRSPDLAAPGDPGHRLAIDANPLIGSGYVAEGVVGFAWSPDPSRAPLYRWLRREGDTRCLTLGERPEGALDAWIFEGTLGFATRPGTRRAALSDLWELVHGGRLAYATAPEVWEAQGYRAQRVVARVWTTPAAGLLGLFEEGTAAAAQLLSSCLEEAGGGGSGAPVGYVEIAVPPPGDPGVGTGGTPEWAVPLDVVDEQGHRIRGLMARRPSATTVPIGTGAGGGVAVGDGTAEILGHAGHTLAPFAVPVYALRRVRDGVTGLSTSTPSSSDWELISVACFLFSDDSAPPTSWERTVAGPTDAPPSATGTESRSRRLSRLVPDGAKRRIRPPGSS